MVIVDATVWIDYLRGEDNLETLWLQSQLTQQPLGLTDLSLCEVLQGVRGRSEFSHACDDLLRFHLFSTGGLELAIAAARNYVSLRERGVTVRKTIDCIVATFCLVAGHELLHRDRDFDAFEKMLGLRVVHP
ncbi:MAG TPA: PIN domain nuclease [Terriglobales bacterium]|nr:PIN domain nuclease [Terriglobales bacterium]